MDSKIPVLDGSQLAGQGLLAQRPVLLIRPVKTADPLLRIKLKTVCVSLDGSDLAEQILPHEHCRDPI